MKYRQLACAWGLLCMLLMPAQLLAQNPTPRTDFEATGTADQQTLEAFLEPTAAAILAQQTRTAAAFPVPDEDIDSLAFLAFGLAFLSMLVALAALIGFIWWRGRRS